MSELGVVVHICNSSTLRQEEHEFEASLDDIAHSMPVWAT
jgi:hypothetical protein